MRRDEIAAVYCTRKVVLSALCDQRGLLSNVFEPCRERVLPFQEAAYLCESIFAVGKDLAIGDCRKLFGRYT